MLLSGGSKTQLRMTLIKKKGTDFSYVIQEVDVATGALIEWLKNVRYDHLSYSSAFFFHVCCLMVEI